MNLPEEHSRRSVQRWEWRGREGSLGAYGQLTQLLETKQQGAAPFYTLLAAKAWQIMQHFPFSFILITGANI